MQSYVTRIGANDKGFYELMKSDKLSAEGILQENRKTQEKTRIISENKHQLRVDEEDVFPISKENEFIEQTSILMKDADVVIFQDYNKGVLTKSTITSLIKKQNNIIYQY